MSIETRIRWFYVAMVAFVIVIGVPVTQVIETSYHNCLDQRANAAQYNGYLDAQVQNAIKSDLLTNQQKAERVAQGRHFHTFVPRHCTGVWPFQP